MRAWVPPRVSAELEQESRRREAETLKVLVAEERYTWKREFDAQLERVIHGMKLMMCPDPAPLDAVAQGAHPGRWNLVWPRYHGGGLEVQPLVFRDGEPRIGGEGEFVEPGSWVFDRLAAMDLWSERVQRDRARIKREAEEEKRRRQERERAEADQDVLERYKAVSRTQISMNRDTPWSQNHAGQRAAKADAARRSKGE